MQKNNDIPYITSLLPQFNARDANTFGEFYSFLYHELYYYTNSLYKSSSQTSEDAIQDAFLYIWEHSSLSFDNLTRLKSYLYLIIRNDFLSSCRKDRITEANRTNYIYEEDFYISLATESEIFAVIPTALNMLPTDCARILKLFLEGWNLREISEQTGLPISTIHSKKDKAISILRQKLKKETFLIILYFLPQFHYYSTAHQSKILKGEPVIKEMSQRI